MPQQRHTLVVVAYAPAVAPDDAHTHNGTGRQPGRDVGAGSCRHLQQNLHYEKNLHKMKQYLDLLRRIVDEGTPKSDRTGTGTRSVFGHQMRFDLRDGFPLLTTKKLHLKSIIYELLWFLRGDTNIAYLNEHGVRIWNEWADENGDLGPVYGHQWRSWPTPDGGAIDQITNVVEMIKSNPESRRCARYARTRFFGIE